MRGARKVVFLGAVIALTALLSAAGKLTGDVVTIYLAAIAAFGAGNAVEHWKPKREAAAGATPDEQP